MGAQQSNHQPARRSDESIRHDNLIIGLGEELQALYLEYDRLEDLAISLHGKSRAKEASDAHDATYGKMCDICSTLSALKAESLEAAAVQMRVISHYSSMEYETVDTKLTALICSVVGVLENHGGFGRDLWAGHYFLGTFDPFERLEA